MNLRDMVHRRLRPYGLFTVQLHRGDIVSIGCRERDVPQVNCENSLRQLVLRHFPGCEVVRASTYTRTRMDGRNMSQYARTLDPGAFQEHDYEIVIRVLEEEKHE